MIAEEFLGEVLSQVRQLGRRELLLVVCAYLRRQQGFAHDFDAQYDEEVEAIFLRSLELAQELSSAKQDASRAQLVAATQDAIESAPDSDDYPDQISLYAQNAMASCYYLLRYCLDDDFANVQASVEKLLETVDVLNVVQSRDEAEAFGYECRVLEQLLNFLKKSASSHDEISSGLQIIAQQGPIQR